MTNGPSVLFALARAAIHMVAVRSRFQIVQMLSAEQESKFDIGEARRVSPDHHAMRQLSASPALKIHVMVLAEVRGIGPPDGASRPRFDADALQQSGSN